MLYILFYEKSAKIHLISVNLKMMWPEAAKKFWVLKCCLCIYSALRAHIFINYDINSCHLGYFLATYQTYLSAANMS